MADLRTTKVIKYNLRERGRTYTGQDRSNVDVPSMVRQINSDAVQEMVATGSLIGYYGHQIRQRFGMNPPETAIAEGQAIRLEPAIKTIELRADPDGTVCHVEQFLDNDSGNFALRQYKGGIGGFSTAVTFKPVGSKLSATGFYGFDYVWQPNYATNKDEKALLDGLDLYLCEDELVMFDSLVDTRSMLYAQSLERQILQNFDSLKTQSYLANQYDSVMDQMGALLQENNHLRDKDARLARLREKREQAVFDSLNQNTRPFADVMAEAEALLQRQQAEHSKKMSTKDKAKAGSTILNCFGVGF